MRAMKAMLRTALRQQLQYRAAALAGCATQFAFGLILVMVYQAFYAGGGSPDMTLSQAVSYAWISQAAYRMMPWSGVRDVEMMMRDGRIAFELARPRDLYGLWFSRALAMRLAPLCLNAPVVCAVSLLLLPQDLRLRLCLPMLPLGLMALLLALLLCAAMTTLLTATYFWTISGQGINRIVPMVGSLLAGNIVPLGLFPDGVRQALRMTPFAGMLDTPLRALVGAAGSEETLAAMALQAAWLIALAALGRAVMRAGITRCMVQGG